MTDKLRIGVLASGEGSNLEALVASKNAGKLDVNFALVISNNPDAGALQRARRHGIPALHIDHRNYASREEYDSAVVSALEQAGVQLVVLAGFMRLLTHVFIDAFTGRIMNIHPALLPAFPGLQVHKKAIEYGARFSGCTVHFVDGGVDTGPIIAQAVVPILDEDTEQTLAARILEQEHRIYPKAVQLFAEGRLQVDGRRVRIAAHEPPENAALLNPPIC